MSLGKSSLCNKIQVSVLLRCQSWTGYFTCNIINACSFTVKTHRINAVQGGYICELIPFEWVKRGTHIFIICFDHIIYSQSWTHPFGLKFCFLDVHMLWIKVLYSEFSYAKALLNNDRCTMKMLRVLSLCTLSKDIKGVHVLWNS